MASARKRKQELSIQEKLVNTIMGRGKKSTAIRIIDKTFEIIVQAGNPKPEKVFEKAMETIKPRLEIKSKRVGGSNYQIPIEVKPERQNTLALRWLIEAARGKKGKTMAEKLASEILDASKGQGNAVKKKEDTHRMAEANKAFAHLAKYI
ncbi:MAG: 30S ribosomal protein S7 [Candidatus Gracilibacteria bacterium]|nr:30S ribosomal protein S7 [Candidatus Gracilibacteria bacterium]